MLTRRAVEGVPERRPEKADCAGDDEGRAPPERQRDRGDERRRDQGAERGADVEEADRDRLLLVREPFCDRLHAGGNRRRFRQSHQAARARQRNPACDAPLQAAGDRPQRRKQGEAEPEADEIDDQPADRLHDRVADLERADDVGILLRADAHLVLQRGREHAERVARKVVDDGAEGDQRDDPPSQASNFRHGSSLRLRHVLASSFWPVLFRWRSRRGLDCRRWRAPARRSAVVGCRCAFRDRRLPVANRVTARQPPPLGADRPPRRARRDTTVSPLSLNEPTRRRARAGRRLTAASGSHNFEACRRR
jgi:hypothetical protein